MESAVGMKDNNKKKEKTEKVRLCNCGRSMFDLIFWLVAGNGDLDLSAAVVECHRPFRPLGASGTATLVVAPSSSSSSSAAAPLPVLPLTAANEFHTHDLPLASPCAHQSDSERSPMLIVVSAPTSSIHQLLSG